MSSLISQMYEVAKWIEPGVISEAIFELDEVKTVDQAKKVWLDFLETELHDGLERSAQALKEKGCCNAKRGTSQTQTEGDW